MTLSDQTFTDSDRFSVTLPERSRPLRSGSSEVHADRCEAKQAFLTKDEANRMRHRVSKVSGERYGIYQCPSCHCWHFTSER